MLQPGDFSCPVFSDSKEIEGYGHLLASACRNLEYFHPGDANKRVELRKRGEEWINKVETELENLKGEEIQDCLNWYDIIHRQVFSRPAKFKYIHDWMLRAMTDMARGEKADKVRFMNWIKTAMYLHAGEIDKSIKDWYRATLDRWVKKYSRVSGSEMLQDDDSLRIVNFLLEEDLSFRINNQKQFKHQIIKALLPVFDNVKFPHLGSTLSRNQLEAIGWFSFLAGQEFPEISYEEIRFKTLELLSELTTLDAYSRQAFSLDLHYERQTILFKI